jgi:hypothetical protein
MWDELGVRVMLLERGMIPETLKDWFLHFRMMVVDWCVFFSSPF